MRKLLTTLSLMLCVLNALAQDNAADLLRYITQQPGWSNGQTVFVYTPHQQLKQEFLLDDADLQVNATYFMGYNQRDWTGTLLALEIVDGFLVVSSCCPSIMPEGDRVFLSEDKQALMFHEPHDGELDAVLTKSGGIDSLGTEIDMMMQRFGMSGVYVDEADGGVYFIDESTCNITNVDGKLSGDYYFGENNYFSIYLLCFPDKDLTFAAERMGSSLTLTEVEVDEENNNEESEWTEWKVKPGGMKLHLRPVRNNADQHYGMVLNRILNEQEILAYAGYVYSPISEDDEAMKEACLKELEVMRNFILAFNGYDFGHNEWFDYFSQFTWYWREDDDTESDEEGDMLLNDEEFARIEIPEIERINLLHIGRIGQKLRGGRIE